MVAEYAMPKMVKNVDDECYGKSYANSKDECNVCWIKKSCEANYKAYIKKLKAEENPKEVKPRPKPYKKTDKYREWY